MRVEDRIDHFDDKPTLIHVAFGKSIIADRLNEIATGNNISFESRVTFEWLGLIDSGTGNG